MLLYLTLNILPPDIPSPNLIFKYPCTERKLNVRFGKRRTSLKIELTYENVRVLKLKLKERTKTYDYRIPVKKRAKTYDSKYSIINTYENVRFKTFDEKYVRKRKILKIPYQTKLEMIYAPL